MIYGEGNQCCPKCQGIMPIIYINIIKLILLLIAYIWSFVAEWWADEVQGARLLICAIILNKICAFDF